MSLVHTLINFVLHIDKQLFAITQQYGFWSYLVLFGVIFMETGLVVMPFLPGDSLLFAAGSLAALGSFNIVWLWLLCVVAAFVGDTVNYWIGHFFGQTLIEKYPKLIKKEHLHKAEAFYAKHGGFAIVLARFVPIVRTVAPFVAGVSKMPYRQFLTYNLVGGLAWVSLFTLAGFFFGQVPFVQTHFEYVMVAIVAISVVPILLETIKAKMAQKSA